MLYEAILSSIEDILQAGERPVAFRINREGFHTLYEMGVARSPSLQAGGKVFVIDTPFGVYGLVIDNALGEQQHIALCRIQTDWIERSYEQA